MDWVFAVVVSAIWDVQFGCVCCNRQLFRTILPRHAIHCNCGVYCRILNSVWLVAGVIVVGSGTVVFNDIFIYVYMYSYLSSTELIERKIIGKPFGLLQTKPAVCAVMPAYRHV